MPILVLLLGASVWGVVRLRRRHAGTDLATRIVTAATHRLPAERRDWGRAMLAELAHIDRPARRWRFAAGVVRVALLPPAADPHQVVGVAALGSLITAVAFLATSRAVPSLTVFITVLSLTLCAYATLTVARTARTHRGRPHLIVGGVVLTGVGAAVVSLVRIAATHPGATTDHSHVYSVLCAVILSGYVAAALRTQRANVRPNTVLWWGLAGGLAGGGISVTLAVASPDTTSGIVALLSPIGVGATVVAAIGAALTSRNRATGIRAGVLTAILSALIRFTIDLTTLADAPQYALTGSGLPGGASHVISDAIGGAILGGLVLYPLALCVVALVGATIGTGLRLHRLQRDVPAN